MKQKKSIAVLIAALVLSMVLAGCTGGKHGDSDEDVTKGASQTTTAAYSDSAEDLN